MIALVSDWVLRAQAYGSLAAVLSPASSKGHQSNGLWGGLATVLHHYRCQSLLRLLHPVAIRGTTTTGAQSYAHHL